MIDELISGAAQAWNRSCRASSRPLARGIGSFVRAAVGFLFVCHGVASLFGVLGGAHPDAGSVPFGTWPSWYAAVIQFVAGGLVLVGLFTRPAALLCSGSMAYAYFVVHQPEAGVPASEPRCGSRDVRARILAHCGCRARNLQPQRVARAANAAIPSSRRLGSRAGWRRAPLPEDAGQLVARARIRYGQGVFASVCGDDLVGGARFAGSEEYS